MLVTSNYLIMRNTKNVIRIPKLNICFYSISVTIYKLHWSAVNSWNKKELCFDKKAEMLKIGKLNFNKVESN